MPNHPHAVPLRHGAFVRLCRFLARAGRFALRWAFALILSAWSLTLGLPWTRSRRLLDGIVRHFGWERLLGEGVDPRLPRVSIEELFPEGLTAPMILPTPDDGTIAPLELAVLNALVTRYRPLRLFEIGTFTGRTTANLAHNSPPDATVYTLDLPPSAAMTAGALAPGEAKYTRRSRAGDHLDAGRSTESDRIVQLYGDSGTFDFAPYEGQMDFVFVDGSHHADYVRNDTEAALRLIGQTGGLIVWHDYANAHWPGVTAVLDAYAADPRLSKMRHVVATTLVLCEIPPDAGTTP